MPATAAPAIRPKAAHIRHFARQYAMCHVRIDGDVGMSATLESTKTGEAF